MFRAPATTNGAICLSSRSRPPQHFASHLPRSFLRPSSPVVLPLLLFPLLPSLRRPFLSATSSSSWSVGRSTFRPLCRLHHCRVSSSLSTFLFFSSSLFQPVPPRFTFDGGSTPPRPLSSSTFTTSEHCSLAVDRSCWQECNEKLVTRILLCSGRNQRAWVKLKRHPRERETCHAAKLRARFHARESNRGWSSVYLVKVNL